MKIILLFGPGEVGKRNEALRIKKQFSLDAISQIDLKTASPKELELALASNPLFSSGPKLLVAENIPDSLDLQEIRNSDQNLTLLLLAENPKGEDLLLKSARNLGARISVFEGEKELTAFPFLDSLIEQKKQAYVELNKLFAQYGAMYILAMVYYLLRRNILPLPAKDFLRQKIQRQKQKFSLSDFTKFYYLALQTEFGIKNGTLEEKMGLTKLTQDIISPELHAE